jgi:hypothetical protein
MLQVSKILFCHETLHVSGIYCAHHQELSAVHVAIGMFHAGYVAAAADCSPPLVCATYGSIQSVRIPDTAYIQCPPEDERCDARNM